MSTYTEIIFENTSTEQSEILVAELSDVGFEGFEEGDKTLKAFIPSIDFNEDLVKEIAKEKGLNFSVSIIEEINWNEVWESNFSPIKVDHPLTKDPWVYIRASFHQSSNNTRHEIIITPKMSFGTGHHATTYMMVQQMSMIDFTGKTVLDFGTGTGILAILAEKLGAASVSAIDNDDWSINNAKENITMNHCDKIELAKNDKIPAKNRFDIILANINKNVILDNFSALISALKTGGTLLISGLLNEDEKDILAAVTLHNAAITQGFSQGNWCCLRINH